MNQKQHHYNNNKEKPSNKKNQVLTLLQPLCKCNIQRNEERFIVSRPLMIA